MTASPPISLSVRRVPEEPPTPAPTAFHSPAAGRLFPPGSTEAEFTVQKKENRPFTLREKANSSIIQARHCDGA